MPWSRTWLEGRTRLPRSPSPSRTTASSPREIRGKAGAAFILVITIKDKAAEEFESRDLRIEKAIPGGKTTRLKMPALKPGSYDFVGEYHEKAAKGRIVAE